MEQRHGGRDDGRDGAGHTKVTVAHDYFTQRGGAERVAVLLAETLGGGAVTTSAFLPSETFPEVGRLSVRQLLPWLPRPLAARRAALGPLAGLAFLLHTVHDGVVVASTSGWAHWMRGRAPRVLYCHTPARWLYEPDDYFRDAPRWLRRILRLLLSPLGIVDRQRMRSAAVVVANGPVTARRIRRAYGMDAPVVIPPPGLGPDGPQEPVEGVGTDFCLTVARPRGYKNLDLVTSVFSSRRQEQLVVVGGTARPVTDQHVLEVGRVSDAQLRWLYQHARAVVCVAQEDLGLVPIEAFQFGTPAVALRAGGYLATCTPGRNAVFVESEDAAALDRALDQLRDQPLDLEDVRESGETFSVEHFSRAMGGLVAAAAASADAGRRADADGLVTRA
ncbi:Glycosyltransferase involved in cell wall bisynthesis [Geodermatophilus amargosae]|uniref:GDP-Man:Man(1)GlcNAc(2)-PP-Dol alpha-1,3-mannosyltransferase n=1 Tax=Geodermatophilus amargosae TaxID=1296565 RepID=A0A1I6X701_9ACTN|nr:glycosyltransferase [Geodermatophilus amargosae]SFT34017.1 Glycosyltransferase involved in cell wall bisynthesis [Geodermatophilus amargosae]